MILSKAADKSTLIKTVKTQDSLLSDAVYEPPVVKLCQNASTVCCLELAEVCSTRHISTNI